MSLYEKIMKFHSILPRIWDGRTASDSGGWSKSNPAHSQCAVTSLLAQDLFGGDIAIVNYQMPDGSTNQHYFNIMPNGQKVDFTNSQFPKDTEFSPPRNSMNDVLRESSKDFMKSVGFEGSVRDMLLNAKCPDKYVSCKMRYDVLKRNYNGLASDMKAGLGNVSSLHR